MNGFNGLKLKNYLGRVFCVALTVVFLAAIPMTTEAYSISGAALSIILLTPWPDKKG